MLHTLSALRGLELQAQDGILGTVSDFLVDDRNWQVRWMVIDTGVWLTGRKVLIHPAAVISADYATDSLSVALTKAQVAESPDILSDRPVSQQMQTDIYTYYGWNPMWSGGTLQDGRFGGPMLGGGESGAIAAPFSAPAYFGAHAEPAAAEPDLRAGQAGLAGGDDVESADPHLRSIAEITGYHVHAVDGAIGHVADYLLDSATWGVRYLVVDTSNWWIGQQVLIAPQAVTAVQWADHHMELSISRAMIRDSPLWDAANSQTGTYEARAQQHYAMPG